MMLSDTSDSGLALGSPPVVLPGGMIVFNHGVTYHQARVSAQAGVITYESPTAGTFITGWDANPTINGEPIALRRYPLVGSAWAHSEFGSGKLVLTYGDEVYELWFNQ